MKTTYTMKNIFKYLLLFVFAVTISCDNEDMELLSISISGSGEITAPETGAVYVLNPEENQLNTIFTLTWSPAEYGIPTEIKYNVEFAKAGSNFAEPFLAGSTLNNYLSWNIQEFNGAAVSAGLTPFVEEELDVRVIAYIGELDSSPQASAPITVKVTAFTTDLPTIGVPGNHQGWDPATAPLLAASAFGETDYEGYVWLDGGYKFIAPNDEGSFLWGNTDWGDDGTNSGVLVESDETDCNADAGYYLVKADTEALTYSTTAVNWGIIGEATPTGWDSDTDFTYDPDTRTLYVDINLSPGPFKFRGNDEWGAFDLGTEDADGYLQNGGDLTFDGPAGNYRVVLDLSNPREYTYSVTAN
jgi:hypothetical protein